MAPGRTIWPFCDKMVVTVGLSYVGGFLQAVICLPVRAPTFEFFQPQINGMNANKEDRIGNLGGILRISGNRRLLPVSGWQFHLHFSIPLFFHLRQSRPSAVQFSKCRCPGLPVDRRMKSSAGFVAPQVNGTTYAR